MLESCTDEPYLCVRLVVNVVGERTMTRETLQYSTDQASSAQQCSPDWLPSRTLGFVLLALPRGGHLQLDFRLLDSHYCLLTLPLSAPGILFTARCCCLPGHPYYFFFSSCSTRLVQGYRRRRHPFFRRAGVTRRSSEARLPPPVSPSLPIRQPASLHPGVTPPPWRTRHRRRPRHIPPLVAPVGCLCRPRRPSSTLLPARDGHGHGRSRGRHQGAAGGTAARRLRLATLPPQRTLVDRRLWRQRR